MGRTIPAHDDPLDGNLANDAAIARAAMSGSPSPGARAAFLRTFYEPDAVEEYRRRVEAMADGGGEGRAGAFASFREALVRHYERVAEAAGLCDVDAESYIAALTRGLDEAERGVQGGRSAWDQADGPDNDHREDE